MLTMYNRNDFHVTEQAVHYKILDCIYIYASFHDAGCGQFGAPKTENVVGEIVEYFYVCYNTLA